MSHLLKNGFHRLYQNSHYSHGMDMHGQLSELQAEAACMVS